MQPNILHIAADEATAQGRQQELEAKEQVERAKEQVEMDSASEQGEKE